LADEDPIFVGKQFDSAAAGKFRRQPDAGTHLRVAGGVSDKTTEFPEIMCCKRGAGG
jgi:hypothetical protein